MRRIFYVLLDNLPNKRIEKIRLWSFHTIIWYYLIQRKCITKPKLCRSLIYLSSISNTNLTDLFWSLQRPKTPVKEFAACTFASTQALVKTTRGKFGAVLTAFFRMVQLHLVRGISLTIWGLVKTFIKLSMCTSIPCFQPFCQKQSDPTQSSCRDKPMNETLRL